MAAIYVECCLINCLYMYRYKSFFLACAAVTPCYELFSPLKVAFVCKQRTATWRTIGAWEVMFLIEQKISGNFSPELHYPQRTSNTS